MAIAPGTVIPQSQSQSQTQTQAIAPPIIAEPLELRAKGQRAKIDLVDNNNWFTSVSHLQNLVRDVTDKLQVIEYESRQVGALTDAIYEAIDQIQNKKPSFEIVDIVEEKDSLE